MSNFLSGIKTLNGKQVSCPKCNGYKIGGRNETVGNLVLVGILTLPLLGLGVIFIVLGLLYLIANKSFFQCKSCGYKWFIEKSVSNKLDTK